MGKRGGYSGGSTIIHCGSGWHTRKRRAPRGRREQVDFEIDTEPAEDDEVQDDPEWRLAFKDARKAASREE